MVTEERRYKAYTLNIAGFALMTPLGKVFLDYVGIFKEIGLGWFIFNFVFSVFFFLVGLTFVDRGRSILEERRRVTDTDGTS